MAKIEDLFSKRLLFVTGKGGIGKTITTALLGAQAAAAGYRVLLVENTPISQIPQNFGGSPSIHSRQELRPNLFTVNLDAKQCLKEYFVAYLGKPWLYSGLINNRIAHSFLNAIPGLQESLLLGRLFYQSEIDTNNEFDLILFDSYASGHFFSFISTPSEILNTQMSGQFLQEIKKVQNFLADFSKTGVLVVTTAEGLAVNETSEFLGKMHTADLPSVDGIVLNRFWPQNSPHHHDMSKFKVLESYMTTKSRLSKLAVTKIIKLAKDFHKRSGRQLPLLQIPEMGALAQPLDEDAGSYLRLVSEQPSNA